MSNQEAINTLNALKRTVVQRNVYEALDLAVKYLALGGVLNITDANATTSDAVIGKLEQSNEA